MINLAWIVWPIVIIFEAVLIYFGYKHDEEKEQERRKSRITHSQLKFVSLCERERKRLEDEIK